VRSASREGDALLGLDLGTSSAKVAAFDLRGRCLAQATTSYETAYPGEGRAEQRVEQWQAVLQAALQDLARQLGSEVSRIAGLGLSGHGPGFVLVDAQHRALTPAITWQDTRAEPFGQRLVERVGPDWVGNGLPLAGLPARLAWALATIPELASRARWAMGVKDYLALWLTGKLATDPSSSAGGEAWSAPVFAELGWSLDRLPPVHPPTSVVGTLRPEIAPATGWPAGLPVVLGLLDGAAASLGSGALRPGETIGSLGTSAVLRFVLARPIPPQQRLDAALFCWPYVDGRWIAGGNAKSGGAALAWLARVLGLDVATLAAAAAASPPGSRGVLFLPYLAGRGSPSADSEARGAFLGLSLEHDQPDLARAVLEGVALALREVATLFDRLGVRTATARLTGSGGTSPLWRQILADVLGCSILHGEGDAALGAAIVAAVGLGLHPSFEVAVEAMVPPASVTAPDDARQQLYAAAYASYLRTRDRLFPGD
jgi:sugar (pentulose or hexulose) kinase